MQVEAKKKTKQELIKEYKKTLSQLETEERHLTETESRGVQSQEALDKAKRVLADAEQHQASSDLTTLKAVENANTSTEKARSNHDNCERVLENIEQAKQNLESATSGLRTESRNQKHLICVKLAEEKAKEIKAVAGHLFNELAAIGTDMQHSRYQLDGPGVPDILKFILAKEVDLREIQKDIFDRL